MSDTVETGKDAASKAAEMLRQVVGGAAPSKPAAAPASSATLPAKVASRRIPFGATTRLVGTSAAALAFGLALGLMAAPGQRSDDTADALRAGMEAGRTETARLAQEIDRLTRTVAGLREAGEAARSEVKTLHVGLSDRIARTEQTVERRLTTLTETVSRAERDHGERIAALIGQMEKKVQTVAAAAPAKVEPKPEVRAPEPTQTGSLPDKPKTETLEGWALRDVYDGVAILEDRRRRLVEVGRGDAVPGVGRVEAIERRGRQWVVVTRQGVITPQAW